MSLLPSESCRSGGARRAPLPGRGDVRTPANVRGVAGALAAAAAAVHVDFGGGELPQRPDTPQNDDIMARGGLRSGISELSDVIKG